MIDYGGGNVGSLVAALERRGADFALTGEPASSSAPRPRSCPATARSARPSTRLRERGLDGAVRAVIAAGRPFLGICVGMQVLFDSSDEYGGAVGLRYPTR